MTHRRLPSIAAFAALSVVLAACQITITPTPTWPPTFSGTVEAQPTYEPTAQYSGTLAPGATRSYQVDVDVVRDLVYAEVQGGSGLRVSLYSSGGTRLAVSESATYFAASLSALSSSADAVSASSIAVTFPCLGPCVAVPSTASSYVAVVTNTSGSSRGFELFAYTFDETDDFESNDLEASATLLNGADTYVGAIEALGDHDYFEYNATQAGEFFVVFDPFDAALGLELVIVNCPDCQVLDGTTGGVRSSLGRAGPSATSGYSIQVTATAPAASVSTR